MLLIDTLIFTNALLVLGTPVFAIEKAAASILNFSKLDCLCERKDISLQGEGDGGKVLAFLINNIVRPDEADLIIQIAEEMGFRPDAPGIRTPPGMRMNKSVHWLSNEFMMGEIYRRIKHLLPAELDGDEIHDRLSHRLNMYKYDDGDVFNKHIDGDWPGYGLNDEGDAMEEWSDVHSKLSMLLYLNGPEEGVKGKKSNHDIVCGRLESFHTRTFWHRWLHTVVQC